MVVKCQLIGSTAVTPLCGIKLSTKSIVVKDSYMMTHCERREWEKGETGGTFIIDKTMFDQACICRERGLMSMNANFET